LEIAHHPFAYCPHGEQNAETKDTNGPCIRNFIDGFMHSFCPHPTFKRNTSKNHFGFTVTALPTGLRLIATRLSRKDNLDGIERVALSFGLSIAITPLLGLGLNYTPFGIRLTPILIVLPVFTIALAIGAWVRRSEKGIDLWSNSELSLIV
jgi:hypothetical protein